MWMAIVLCSTSILLPALLLAQEQAPTAVDFVRDVRPIFELHCYECHSGDQPSSSLRLDHKQSAMAGGELYGADLIHEQVETSVLIQVVSDEEHELRMPPEGDSLSPAEIEILKKWVTQGAPWPDGIDEVELADPRDHWAFRPLECPTVPSDINPSWARTPIDHFIAEKLASVGLRPNHEASRHDWLRRVSFDLTGLPPTTAEINDFIHDHHPLAYERVVERLLASPRYGERAAQHWFDVVRYADTHGFEVNTERPNAWPYRDYVIEALNQDTPYDRFVQQQLIGDTNGFDAATGFLITASVLLPGQIGQDEPSKRLARQDALDEIVVNIGQTFLGLTVGCARCHNHKFDPISQVDYFAMQAFVAGVEYEDRLIRDAEADKQTAALQDKLAAVGRRLAKHAPLVGSGVERPAVNSRYNIERFDPQTFDRVRLTILSTNLYEPCIDELQVFDRNGTNVAWAGHGTTAIASGSNTAPDRHELRFVNDGIFGNSRSWMSNEVGGGWVEIRLAAPTEIERIEWGRDRLNEFGDRLPLQYRIEAANGNEDWVLISDHSDRAAYNAEAERIPIDVQPVAGDKDATATSSTGTALDERRSLWQDYEQVLAELRKNPAGGRPIFAGRFRAPDDIHLLRRGDPEQPQQPVPPAVPKVLGDLTLDRQSDEQVRRQALANWIADTNNPLTARVMANRIWQSHFGIGLVETANDFGRNGSAPTHPELLDWLASELIASGWSMKELHRTIVLSATYRQSSVPNSAGNEIDADVRLLWRYPLRRLEGEAIRDAILSVTGQLTFTMGGPGYDLFDKRGGLTGFEPVEKLTEANSRRMVFAHRVRRERDAVFGAFDCPDGGQSTPRRRESTTPIQALNLLNSTIVVEQAALLAESLSARKDSTVSSQIQDAYLQILGRTPSNDEVQLVTPVVEKYGLTPLCRALFNSNEFLYIR